jgi:protein gp37
MSKTKIPWAERVWNPTAGCKKISTGCRNCYAEKMSNRLAGMPQQSNKYGNVITKGKWNGSSCFDPESLKKPYEWKGGRTIFVCSMSDLFYEKNFFAEIYRVFEVIRTERQHRFLVLTKRPERMAEFINWYGEQPLAVCLGAKLNTVIGGWPFPNLWLGVTAENQKMANERIPILLDIPAAKRFVSIEPILEQIDLTNYLYTRYEMGGERNMYNQLDWVICGAESGSKRRPMDINWARLLKNQCTEAKVPFFFKQAYEGEKRIHMPLLDGVIYNQTPGE